MTRRDPLGFPADGAWAFCDGMVSGMWSRGTEDEEIADIIAEVVVVSEDIIANGYSPGGPPVAGLEGLEGGPARICEVDSDSVDGEEPMFVEFNSTAASAGLMLVEVGADKNGFSNGFSDEFSIGFSSSVSPL